MKAFGVRPGDLITVTYLKEGFDRQPFRVLKIAPGVNHRITTITAQIHDDSWYADSNGQVSSAGGRRQSIAGMGVPRPLLGSVLDENGDVQFGVEESATTASDGTEGTSVRRRSCRRPSRRGGSGDSAGESCCAGRRGRIVRRRAECSITRWRGSIDDGNEGALSFLVRASVTIAREQRHADGLSFARGNGRRSTFIEGTRRRNCFGSHRRRR